MTNHILEYNNWLDAIDPRLKDILVKHGDEYQTGRSGEHYLAGMIEFDVFNLDPDDFDQFRDMMAIVDNYAGRMVPPDSYILWFNMMHFAIVAGIVKIGESMWPETCSPPLPDDAPAKI